MDKIKERHVQLPHVNPNDVDITPRERLVYLYIKKYADSKTNEAFPSLAKLQEDSGISIPTLRNCIAVLEKNGYISVRKKGRQQIYTFNNYKKFEPISLDLLSNKEMSFTEKSMVACAIEKMQDKGVTGEIRYSNKELSKMINMPESTVSKCMRTLIDKGYLVVTKTEKRDLETGCKREIKIFDLEKIGQAVFYVLKNHEDRIQENTSDILDIKEELEKEKAARIASEEKLNRVLKILEEQNKEKSKVELIL